MIKAVDYVSTILLNNDRHTWEIGPLGHALHALAIYDERVFKDSLPSQPQAVVESPEAAVAPLEARHGDETVR
jgi:hypothetical protein